MLSSYARVPRRRRPSTRPGFRGLAVSGSRARRTARCKEPRATERYHEPCRLRLAVAGKLPKGHPCLSDRCAQRLSPPALVRAAALSDQVRRRCGASLESTLYREGLITPAVIPTANVQENLLLSGELIQRYPYVAFQFLCNALNHVFKRQCLTASPKDVHDCSLQIHWRNPLRSCEHSREPLP
jgi:hypothetical protein